MDGTDTAVRKTHGPGLPPQPTCATLADVLDHCRPHIASALLDADGLRAVRRVAAAVPSELSRFWGLEVRLGEPQARADILWEVRRDGLGAALLAGQSAVEPADELNQLCATAPVWQALRRFAEGWDTQADAVSNLWLEVDAADAESDAALDGRLRRPCLFWGADPDREESGARLQALLPRLARETFGLAVDPDRLAAPLTALPPEADVFQTGVMGGRAGTVVRVCVRNVGVSAAARWLGDIRWPGDIEAATALISGLEPSLGSIALNVDLLPDGTGPKLGLELYQPFENPDPGLWAPVFDRLRAAGLARSDKLVALAAFPGRERFDQRAAIRGDAAGTGYPVIVRSIHHLKLVVVGDRPVEAKAYLGVYRPGIDYTGLLARDGSGDRDPWLLA